MLPRMKMSLLLTVLFLFNASCAGQVEEKGRIVFPQAKYQEDLDALAANLVSIHPSPFEFTKEEDFNATHQKLRNSIRENTELREFIWMCSELVAEINCGHTSLGWFNQEAKLLTPELMFPMDGKLIEGRLYVVDPLSNRHLITPGTEIFSINGVEVETLKDRIFAHMGSQGFNQTYKGMLMSGYLPSYVAYALGFPESFSVMVSGKQQPINLVALSAYKPKPRISPKQACQDNLCLEMKEDQRTALLTIRSFAYYGNKFPEYKAFIDSSFAKIEREGIKNLIIDVRMNDGGPSYAAMHLLKYLQGAPFKYWSKTAFDDEEIETYQPFSNAFDGELFVLMNSECSSTTPHFLSIVKQDGLGTLVGEEVNGNHLTFGGAETACITEYKDQLQCGRKHLHNLRNQFRKG